MLGMCGALRPPASERGKRIAMWSPPLTRRRKLCCAWRSDYCSARVTLITLSPHHSKGLPAWVAHGMAGGWAVGLKVEAFNGRLMRGSTLDSWGVYRAGQKHQVSQRHCYHARAADVPPTSSMIRPKCAMLTGRPGYARVYWERRMVKRERRGEK